MEVKRFACNPFQELTYVLYDETKEAVIIDCGCYNEKEQQRLVDFIEKKELKVVHLLNTHLHIDHVIGNAFIKKQYGLSPEANDGDLFIYESTIEKAAMYGFEISEEPPAIQKFINEGDVISFGNQKLQTIHVPGHSPGSICFYNKEQGIIFVGDVLFQRSIGRADLPGGDMDTLISGIKTKLIPLGDEVIVAPGHGNMTTIVDERNSNPYL